MQKTLNENIAKCEAAHLELIASKEITAEQFSEQDRIYAATCMLAESATSALAIQIDKLTPKEVRPEVGPELTPVRVEIKASDLNANHAAWGRFDGDLMNWQGFKDRFTAAVHNNDNIKPVFKLQHLQAALSGQAASVVGTRQATEAGYQGAWTRLCEIFDDKYLIIRAVLRSIFSMQSIDRPSFEGLRKLIDTVHEAVRQLSVLEVPVAHWIRFSYI